MPQYMFTECAINECPRTPRPQGRLCEMHYSRIRRHGDPHRAIPHKERAFRRRSLIERLYAKVDKAGPVPDKRPDLGPCWLWTGYRNAGGYGWISRGIWKGGSVFAHRAAYEHENGPIPAGLVLDHLCRVRHCVRPSHLEPVTDEVNLKRGAGPTATNPLKTHCLRGHAYTPENTHYSSRGWRSCITCRRERRKVDRPTQPAPAP